jgi:hypothetical protein
METKGWIEITYTQLIEKVIAKENIVVSCEGMTCFYKPLDEGTFVAVGGEILDTNPNDTDVQTDT